MTDINFTSPINQLGFGLVAINTLKEMCRESTIGLNLMGPHPTELINGQPLVNKDDLPLVLKCMENFKDATLTAPSIRFYHPFDMLDHVGTGPHIGMTIFELTELNEREKEHLNQQDCIVVPTKWAQTILEQNHIKPPVLVAPYGTDRAIFNESLNRSSFIVTDAPTPTRFLNVGKWELRKGHDILKEAFNKAFEPIDNVKLTMCCYNPFYSPIENQEWEVFYKNSKMGTKIEVLDKRVDTQYDLVKLFERSDCLVTPSRAEGWGLSNLDAMSMGKHVITTNYAGHTEFCTNENSLLIDFDKLEKAYDGRWFFGFGEWGHFGEPQVDQLVEHMRSIHRKKQAYALGINEAGIEQAKRFSWENSVAELRKTL